MSTKGLTQPHCLGPVFKAWSVSHIHQTHRKYRPISRLTESVSGGRVWEYIFGTNSYSQSLGESGGCCARCSFVLGHLAQIDKGLTPLRSLFRCLVRREVLPDTAPPQSNTVAPVAFYPSLYFVCHPSVCDLRLYYT